MDDAQGSYSHRDGIKELNINLGNPETKSNGHRSRVELVELIKSLQREVKIYREDNERLIKFQEDHNQINS